MLLMDGSTVFYETIAHTESKAYVVTLSTKINTSEDDTIYNYDVV